MSAKLKVDTRVTVETPEGVDFQFVIAGPGKRGGAFVIDAIIKVAVVVVVLMLVGLASVIADGFEGVGMGVVLTTIFAMSWLYGSCCEAFWNGQTPGKRIQKLRVVRTNGTPIGWYEAFGRNLLLVPDSLLWFGIFPLCTAGLLSMAATRRMQRLGDLVFDTMVIDETREFISRAPGITRNVEPLPRAECPARYQVPERTLAVIERLFEGDRLISDGRREEIARTLSLALRQWLGYEDPPPDPTNPNTYFSKTPTKHTAFLKRVLKTFGEAEDGKKPETDPPENVNRPRRIRPRVSSATLPEHLTSTDAVNSSPTPTMEQDGAGTATLEGDVDFSALDDIADDFENRRRGLPDDWRSST